MVPHQRGSRRELDSIARLVAALIESPDAEACDRLLVEAVFTLQASRAAALWRRAGERWQCITSRGSPELLPGDDLVHGILDEELPRTVLPYDRALLRAGSGDGAVALALGGLVAGEQVLDQLEALLHVRRTLGGIGIPLRDLVFPPLPLRGPDDTPREPESC